MRPLPFFALLAWALTVAPATLAENAQAPATQRMARLLAQTAARADPRANPFANGDRLAYIRSVPEPAGPPNALARYLFILGQESVLAGESAAAVEAFERLRLMMEAGSAQLDATSARTVLELTALAYLRLGEQENCVDDHNIDRCLLPIRGSGVHTRTRGSRGAIRVYEEILARDPENLDFRWLLNLAYMTLGEHPRKVPPRYLIPAGAFDAERRIPRFRDVAQELGLDVFGLAGGSIMDDFNGDGFLDIVASAWSLHQQLRYFESDGEGGFRDATEEAGLSGIVDGLNISHADVDNDGRLDVLVLRGGWLGDAGRLPNSLLRNVRRKDGGVTFVEIAEESHLLSLHPTQVGVWADYDGDGWIDLFVGNETTGQSSRHPAELFHNGGATAQDRGADGNVTFTEVAAQVGIDVAVPIKGAAWGDIDNDGLPDLFISNNHGDNLLFHNRGPRPGGGWSFEEIGGPAGVRAPKISFPTWFWDYDHDGFEDIFVSGYAGTLGDLAAEYLGRPVDPAVYPRLYRNNGDLTFSDVAPKSGLARVLVTMGANFGDIDNDGWLDFYASTGNTQMQTLMPNRMFRNAGGTRFEDVTEAGGFGHLQKGHGIAFGDLDHDGDQDIYAVMGGSHSGDGFHNALFLNPGNDNRWINLELVGVECNRAAIGARLKLGVDTPSGPRDLYRTVGSGGSFGSSTYRQEIGLGKATAIRGLQVLWPGNRAPQMVVGLEMDRFYRIRQGQAEPELLERPSFELGGGASAGHRHP